MKTTAFKKHTRLAAALCLLAVFIVTAALPAFAAYPRNNNNVADEAKVLSESTIRTIQSTNDALEEDLDVSIAVCTVKTTGETDIKEYTTGLFKDWKLGEGVLLLIAAEDDNYYLLQSTGVEKIITNEVLAEVRNNYLEDDFASGSIDRGVLKAVSRLSALLVSGFEDLAREQAQADEENGAEDKSTTIGGVIIGFFKFLLFAVLFLVAAFIVLFIAAMFNDDCAAILQKYVFRRSQSGSAQQNYYDERLYGQPRRQENPYAQSRRHAPNGQAAPRRNPDYAPRQNAYRSQMPPSQLPAPGRQPNRQTTYYNADGTPRRMPQNSRQPAPQQPSYNPYAQQPYRQGQPAQQRPQQRQTMNGDETRAFTIPNRQNR